MLYAIIIIINYYELCTYTIDVYVYTCTLIIFMMNKLTILIQLMYNYTYRPLCFMMNKLTCKHMNTSVWCGESGQLQVSHEGSIEEPYVIYILLYNLIHLYKLYYIYIGSLLL